MKPHYLSLIVLFLGSSAPVMLPLAQHLPDGGPISSSPAGQDAGVVPRPPNLINLDGGPPALDGGTLAPQSKPSPEEAISSSSPDQTQKIQWPEELQPLAILDGPAVLAANAALQHVLGRFPEKYKQTCAYSAKALEVLVGQQDGLYFVRINRRLDKCGQASPGLTVGFDWFELYAVSPDGLIIKRYPYQP